MMADSSRFRSTPDTDGMAASVVAARLPEHAVESLLLDVGQQVAVALALARLLTPHVCACPRGLRICVFSAEEWGLVGSRLWLERMDAAARRSMLINVNLDSVAGACGLTALTSGFERLDAWVKDTAACAGPAASKATRGRQGTFRNIRQS